MGGDVSNFYRPDGGTALRHIDHITDSSPQVNGRHTTLLPYSPNEHRRILHDRPKDRPDTRQTNRIVHLTDYRRRKPVQGSAQDPWEREFKETAPAVFQILTRQKTSNLKHSKILFDEC